jgi:cell division protein FtsW (lipid II flippase)
VVGVGGYICVGIGRDQKVDMSGPVWFGSFHMPDLVSYGLWLAGLILVAHIAIRIWAPYSDPVLLPIVAMLNGLGLAEIHRLDLAAGLTNSNGAFARQQLIWMTIGVALFCITIAVLRDHRLLQRFTYTCGLGAVILLLLPMLPGIGNDVNGARIWIHVGPMSFQPGEVAKVLLVVCFAGYLVLHRDALALAGRRVLFIDLPRGRDLGPILLMWLVSIAILVRQSDLGSSLLFFGLFVVMLYVSTERRGWIVVGTGLFLVAAVAAAKFVSHVSARVDIWLHPFHYFNTTTGPSSDQLVNGLFGLGWGGLLGTGLGAGEPWRVPYANSDFIIASLGEELGLTGLIAILLCYGLIVERGLRTAVICRDDFGKLLAVGLATSFAIQVFVIVGGVTRLVPLTGLTTPFLSYGGSSLVANWVIIALLLRISDQARMPLPDLAELDTSDDATQVVKL